MSKASQGRMPAQRGHHKPASSSRSRRWNRCPSAQAIMAGASRDATYFASRRPRFRATSASMDESTDPLAHRGHHRPARRSGFRIRKKCCSAHWKPLAFCEQKITLPWNLFAILFTSAFSDAVQRTHANDDCRRNRTRRSWPCLQRRVRLASALSGRGTETVRPPRRAVVLILKRRSLRHCRHQSPSSKRETVRENSWRPRLQRSGRSVSFVKRFRSSSTRKIPPRLSSVVRTRCARGLSVLYTYPDNLADRVTPWPPPGHEDGETEASLRSGQAGIQPAVRRSQRRLG